VSVRISQVAFHVPVGNLTNEALSLEFPEWGVEKISAKTGIANRHIASSDEFVSSLAAAALRKLLAEHESLAEEIDFLLLCTQTPDFFLPSTACLVQDLVGLPNRIGAIDINQGCSGYIYSLGLAKGLIDSGQANKVAVVTADTYSKLLNPADKSVRTIFGDAATATLVVRDDSGVSGMTGITFGTDGSGAKHLIVPRGGIRTAEGIAPKADSSLRGVEPGRYDLFMDGPEIFNFTLRAVPRLRDDFLAAAGLAESDIDLYIVHQANSFMLEHLRKKLGVPPERFLVSLADTGNTVSSTIPIALARAEAEGLLIRGMKLMLLGFGVGLSWAGMVVDW